MIKFSNKTRFFGGSDAVLKNKAVFNGVGKKALIVTGNKSAELCGALGDVKQALDSLGIEYSIYNKITQNPLLSTCYDAASVFKQENCDFLIGIGGGSPLDATKVIAAIATNDFDGEEVFTAAFNNKPAPFFLISTTAGTGSEVTNVSVITIDSKNMKKSIKSDDLYALASFGDSKYTYSLPREFTVSTALDALAHAVESYFAKTANDFTDMLSLNAIKTICQILPNIDNLDNNMRDELYDASVYAGISLNECGTCFPHPFGYVLTEDFNVPHGRACAVFLDDLIVRAEKYLPVKTEKLLNTVNMKRDEFISLINENNKLNVRCSKEQLQRYYKRFDGLKNYANTPGGFDNDLALETFCKKFGK